MCLSLSLKFSIQGVEAIAFIINHRTRSMMLQTVPVDWRGGGESLSLSNIERRTPSYCTHPSELWVFK
jgi:hypothetical protein